MSQPSKPLIQRLRCLATLLQQLNAQTACDAVNEAIESIESTAALRQSQSLPAGAVDEDDWQREYDKEILLNLELLLRPRKWVGRWDEIVRQVLAELDALQADAREKGEVVVPEAKLIESGSLVDGLGGQGSWAIATAFGCRVVNQEFARGWNECQALATQPAQASEKDNG